MDKSLKKYLKKKKFFKSANIILGFFRKILLVYMNRCKMSYNKDIISAFSQKVHEQTREQSDNY